VRGASAAGPDHSAAGTAYALLAYGWWGLTPIYWKALGAVPPLEIVAHRVVWTLALAAAILSVAAGWREVRQILADPRRLGALALTAGLIASNWLIFILAVNTDRVLAASLGYYLNPLVNVALGAVVLRERLRVAQWVAVAIAAGGVGYLALEVGSLPWISITLAGTFGLYGLIRKTAPVSSLGGLAVETLILAPFALALIAHAGLDGSGLPSTFDPLAIRTGLLLAGTGVVTALPLIWFASAARRLRLSTVGLFQYLAPSLNFLLAVAFYGEAFTRTQAVTFGCIWVALAIYAGSARRAAGPPPGGRARLTRGEPSLPR
jgi:chloramphenicol-sensitive protein RarD